ncbi:MAG: phage holin family protein [Rikenellaceae bacterium]|nr:phage holin family protein [Rikenellaceae bacterium]
MEAFSRFCSGALAAMGALFAPVLPLVGCTTLFIFIDFLTGVAADRSRALREGRCWFFESRRAWRTILKAGFIWIAISMAWLLEEYVLGLPSLHLARLLAGFTCGVEMWSFLENAGELSDGPLFRAIRRVARNHITRRKEGVYEE